MAAWPARSRRRRRSASRAAAPQARSSRGNSIAGHACRGAIAIQKSVWTADADAISAEIGPPGVLTWTRRGRSVPPASFFASQRASYPAVPPFIARRGSSSSRVGLRFAARTSARSRVVCCLHPRFRFSRHARRLALMGRSGLLLGEATYGQQESGGGRAGGLALLAFVPERADAQSAIAGFVRDTTGAVLPGVTVEASSPALIEQARTASTDANGLYRIIDLRPGRLHGDVHAARLQRGQARRDRAARQLHRHDQLGTEGGRASKRRSR